MLTEAAVVAMVSRLVGYDPARAAGVFTFGGTGTVLYGAKLGIEKAFPDAMDNGVPGRRHDPGLRAEPLLPLERRRLARARPPAHRTATSNDSTSLLWMVSVTSSGFGMAGFDTTPEIVTTPGGSGSSSSTGRIVTSPVLSVAFAVKTSSRAGLSSKSSSVIGAIGVAEISTVKGTGVAGDTVAVTVIGVASSRTASSLRCSVTSNGGITTALPLTRIAAALLFVFHVVPARVRSRLPLAMVARAGSNDHVGEAARPAPVAEGVRVPSSGPGGPLADVGLVVVPESAQSPG